MKEKILEILINHFNFYENFDELVKVFFNVFWVMSIAVGVILAALLPFICIGVVALIIYVIIYYVGERIAKNK